MFNFSKFFLEKMYFSGKKNVDIFEKWIHFLIVEFVPALEKLTTKHLLDAINEKSIRNYRECLTNLYKTRETFQDVVFLVDNQRNPNFLIKRVNLNYLTQNAIGHSYNIIEKSFEDNEMK